MSCGRHKPPQLGGHFVVSCGSFATMCHNSPTTHHNTLWWILVSCGKLSSRRNQRGIVFLSLKNAIETIKSLFFKPAHLRKVSCTRNEMLKYDLLESQSWLRCPPTCVGQGVAPNSNLPGASLILYLNLLTHTCAINCQLARSMYILSLLSAGGREHLTCGVHFVSTRHVMSS